MVIREPLPVITGLTDDQFRLQQCEQKILEMGAELTGLKSQISALEHKTNRIDIDEEKGILKICNRNYLFQPQTKDLPTVRAWVIAEGSGPAKIVALTDITLAQKDNAFLVGSDSGFRWSEDLSKALRFERLEDALGVISSLRLKEAHPEEYPFMLPIPLNS